MCIITNTSNSFYKKNDILNYLNLIMKLDIVYIVNKEKTKKQLI